MHPFLQQLPLGFSQATQADTGVILLLGQSYLKKAPNDPRTFPPPESQELAELPS